MSSKTGNQSKKYLKQKVNEVIEQYQIKRQQQEQEKLKVKQNIMFEIMSNRQKAQSTTSKGKQPSSGVENTFKTMMSDNGIEEQDDFMSDNHQITFKNDRNASKISSQKPILSDPQSRIEEIQENLETNKIQEITFNGKKRNSSLNEEFSYNKSKFRFDEPEESVISANHSIKPVELDDRSEGQMRKKIKQSINMLKIKDFQQKFEQNQIEVEEMIQHEDENEKDGIFLTMEEDESKSASEVPKNCAFEIKLDKSQPTQNIEELKKAKILQLERKRQQRKEEFKKEQSLRKIQVPKIKSSYTNIRKAKLQHTFEQQQPPKTLTAEKKQGKAKTSKQVSNNNSQGLISLEAHEAQHNLKNDSSKNIKNPSANFDSQKRQLRPVSPFRTPKSTVTQNRGKSPIRPNIFVGQSPNHRDKSTNRLKQPQIQPKDRKTPSQSNQTKNS